MNSRSDSYLMHYGVKGMKWGIRKDPQKGSILGRYNRLKANSIRRDIDSFNGHEGGIKTKKGKVLLSSKDISDIKSSLNKQAKMYDAKAEYHDANKKFEKAYNKWRNRSISAYSPSSKQRHNNDIRYTKLLVSSGERAMAKGKYLQAKGSLKNNQKMIDKGKYFVKQAKISNNYYKVLLSDLSQGKTLSEATKDNEKLLKYSQAAQKANKIREKHRR